MHPMEQKMFKNINGSKTWMDYHSNSQLAPNSLKRAFHLKDYRLMRSTSWIGCRTFSFRNFFYYSNEFTFPKPNSKVAGLT